MSDEKPATRRRGGPPPRMDAAPLARGGYHPVPLRARRKAPDMEGWAEKKWVGTAFGIGVDLAGLAMVDVDISEKDADAVYELFTARLPVSAPIRQRSDSSRIAALVRCPELATKRYRTRTARWAHGHVEIKGGHRYFMFGWGTHPKGARLRWELEACELLQADPLHFPAVEDLPTMSLDELNELRDEFNELCEARYGPPIEDGRPGVLIDGSYSEVFDITPEMVFTTRTGTLTFAEVRAMAQAQTDGGRTFVNLTPWRPNSDSMAGMVGWSLKYDCMYVADFVEGITHYERGIEFEDLPEEDLNALVMLDAYKPLPPPPEAREKAERARAEREHRMAPTQALLMVREAGGYVWRHDPDGAVMAKGSMFTDVPAKHRAEMLEAVQVVQRQVWDPAKPPLEVFENAEMGWTEHNVFCLPQRSSEGGDTTGFHDWFRRVFPDDEERKYLWLWLCAKAQKPWERLFAVCLVGPQGSGKSTVWRLLEAIYGHRNVAAPGTMQDTFKGTFHDSLHQKLYTLFDEVASEDAGADVNARNRAKNALKAFVDTEASYRVLNLKYGKQTPSKVVTTTACASNYPDGLPLDADDRRWAVFTTGPKLDRNTLPEWMAVPANVEALFEEMLAEDLALFDTRSPPMTDAKARMLETGSTESEDLLGEFAELVDKHGGFCARMHLDWFLEHKGVRGKPASFVIRLFKQRFPECRKVSTRSTSVRVRYAGSALAKVGGHQVGVRLDRLSDKLRELSGFDPAESLPV